VRADGVELAALVELGFWCNQSAKRPRSSVKVATSAPVVLLDRGARRQKSPVYPISALNAWGCSTGRSSRLIPLLAVDFLNMGIALHCHR